MIKKVRSLSLFLVLVAVLVTGCAQAVVRVNVHKNGSADLVYRVGIDNSFMSMAQSGNQRPFAGFAQGAKAHGFKVHYFHNAQMTGVIATRHVNSLSEITPSLLNSPNSQSVKGINGGSSLFVVKRTFFNTQYNFGADINLTNMMQGSQSPLSGITSQGPNRQGASGNAITSQGLQSLTKGLSSLLSSQLKVQYVISLPFKAGANNASRVLNNGRTLVWNLVAGRDNVLRMTATVPNTSHEVLPIVIIVVIVAAVVAFLVLRRRRKLKMTTV